MKTAKHFLGTAGLVAIPLFAGGFWIQLGNPEASPEARAMKAAITFMPTGCGTPEKAKVSAVAVGMDEGNLREIPLHLRKLPQPGHYAIVREWPEEGRWLIRIDASDQGRVTSALVPIGRNGPDRTAAKFLARRAGGDEMRTLLASY